MSPPVEPLPPVPPLPVLPPVEPPLVEPLPPLVLPLLPTVRAALMVGEKAKLVEVTRLRSTTKPLWLAAVWPMAP